MISRRALLRGAAALAAAAVMPVEPGYAGEIYGGEVGTYSGVVFREKLTVADIKRCVEMMKAQSVEPLGDFVLVNPRLMIPRDA